MHHSSLLQTIGEQKFQNVMNDYIMCHVKQYQTNTYARIYVLGANDTIRMMPFSGYL